MGDATAVFADAHADLFDALGVDAFVQRGTDAAVPVRVVVEDGVASVGQYGQVIGRNTMVSFLRAQWVPARADLVTIGGTTRKVDALEADDGIVARVVLHG